MRWLEPGAAAAGVRAATACRHGLRPEVRTVEPSHVTPTGRVSGFFASKSPIAGDAECQ